MLSGFNTNFRYRGVLFHVQSEDSGVDNPRVYTHLFKGGDILATMKADYSDKLETENLEAAVRSLMESQHKSMLKALNRGEHDALIIERMGADVFSDTSSPDTDATLPPPELLSEAPQPEPAAVETQPEIAHEMESPKQRIAKAFGDGVVSQKPLDEVVLEYLVDNARKRKRSPK